MGVHSRRSGGRVMDDLIRRSDAIKSVLGITMLQGRVPIDTVIFQINSIPAVEPKQGEWEIIKIEPYNFKFRCKECGWYEHHAYEDVKPYNFCPNCGARMFAKDTNVPNKEGVDDEHDK